MDKKRIRSKNFTEYEKNILFDIVTKEYINIIENKQTDAASNAKKNSAWEEIAKKFNAVSHTGQRTGKQLHALYDNLKKTAKKSLLSDKKNAYKTEGGPFTSASNCLNEKIVSVLKPQLTPSSDRHDSSASYIEDQPSCSSHQWNTTDSDQYNLDDNMSIKIENESVTENRDTDYSTYEQASDSESEPECMEPLTKIRKRQQVPLSTTFGEKQTHIETVTDRFVTRQDFKYTQDKEIYLKKMEILDVEHQIKLKQLEVVTQQFEYEKRMNELNYKARLDEINFKKLSHTSE